MDENMDEKKSFVLYTKNIVQFNMLSDERAGKLIKAIFAYSDTAVAPEFDDEVLEVMFSFIKDQLDYNSKRWEKARKKSEEISQKRAEAGKKGGKQSRANQTVEFDDDMLKMVLSFIESQLDQNSEKSEEISKKRVEAEKKGGKQSQTNVTHDKQIKKPDSNSFSETFEVFWEAYPKKVSRADALKAWNKLEPNDDLVRQILSALEKQKMLAQWQKDDGRFIPYAATWLNGKRWEDEPNINCSFTDKAVRQKEYSFNMDDVKSFVNDFEEYG